MSDSVLVLWDDVLASYDFGRGHPLRPLRLELTLALARDLGVLDRPGVTVRAPASSGDDTLALVHDRDYIAAVKQAPEDLLGRLHNRYGLGSGDNPVFPRMHEAAALVTGASVEAAAAVWEGRAQHAVNIAGGLHHAMRDRASGFCVYDDPAVAIAWLLQAGATRVAYVDVDVHHGDGVQAAFYDDPRVLTVSLHESGSYLFPGTGFPGETGTGDGTGTSVNVALPPGTSDAEWLRAFTAVVPPVLAAYRPQVLVAQLGCDTHTLDPLAHLALSVDGQRAAYALLHGLAHDLCGGRWVVLGGGGYEIVQVVPRSWTHALAEVTGGGVEGETPEGWRDEALRRSGEHAPTRLSDGREVAWREWDGGDPHDPLDRAVIASRDAAFPLLGLAP
ncbi:MAG TPA: acetoin utilization protein AcuC [Mycobacteriales bacterium]|jgi:acetoin utilization protein AcuC|nr:acetoin utilization protein AcuC [Mycobacteriales bacterium]